MATRRQILARLASALGVLACTRAIGQPAARAAYAAIETSAGTGLSRARLLSATGAEVGRIPLDFRAHGMAQHGDRLAVFPRRPGDRFVLVDSASLEVGAPIIAPEGRHFYGHGAFDAGGGLLLVPENDLSDLSGWLAIYATRGLRAHRLDALPLPRPGPHEVVRTGDSFHIALGGLQTHPAYGRTPLNLDEFRSDVVTLDAGGGMTPLDIRADGISLRHLAQDGRGRLYIGGQRPEGTDAKAPVLWVVDGGRAMPLADGGHLGGYVSSVAADADVATVTSKVTGTVLTLDGAHVIGRASRDGASAAAVAGAMTAVSGHSLLTLGSSRITAAPGFEFDNHGLALRVRADEPD